MLKKFTLILAIVLLSTTLSKAQWTNLGIWPKDSTIWQAQNNNAVAVDGDGKIWLGRYGSVSNFIPPGATKPLRKSVYLTYVFNPDGTQASFSPIFQIMGDTMYSQTQRGFRTNIDGDIVMTIGVPAMYIVDHKTGLGKKKVSLPSANGPTGPCVAANGTIFVATVFQGQRPVEMYDQNLNLIGNAITNAPGYSRTFEVSKDGNTIYWAGYTNGKVYVYSRASEFDPFSLKDSIMIGAHVESFAWRPNTNELWMSGGSSTDPPDAGSKWTIGTWYAYDVAKKQVVDSLKMIFKDPTKPDERPRGLAFSQDGKTAYIGQFGTSKWMCQKLVKGVTDVKQIDQIPTGYELSQNYPNPFNPTTNIQFSIPEQGFVSLKIYNTLGQEVATLVNEIKNVGAYRVDFDASRLSSGVYMYILSTGKIVMSKKMLLMK